MPEYVHVESGRSIGAPPGSHIEIELAGSPEWKLVEPSVSVDEFDGLNRKALNELAAEHGVDGAEALPNKDAVKAAIRKSKEFDSE